MRRRVFLVIAPFFLAAFAATINAQAPRQVSTVERRIDTMNRQAKEYDWEDMAREKKGESARKTENLKRSKQIRTEIEEDLKAIQNAYNNIVTALQTKGAIADEYALGSASEIRKHASRLKTNLSLPKPAEEEKPLSTASPIGTRRSLTELCQRIYEFITNPIFETQTGLNVEHATKAGRSLDSVIDLADRIAAMSETANN